MAAYLPPSENVPIFDPILFSTNDDALTYEQASKLFLRYPFAQGTENLQAINVSGAADFGNTIQVAGVSTLNNTVNITTSTNTNIQPSLKVQASNGGDYNINFIPRTGQGAYNPISQALDTLIFSNAPTMGTTSLVLTTHSSTHSGVRIAPSSVSIGAGSGSITATTEVKCDGTNVIVKPDLKYPDNTIQDSAFTGAGASAGSYTNTNLTLDSNGKITAISSGSSGTSAWTAYTTVGGQTITVPPTATKVKIYVIGGGGGGGGGIWYGSVPPSGYYLAGSTGGGGGGVSYIETTINPVSVPTLYLFVGSGGAGAPGSASPINGSNGGNSYVYKINASGVKLITANGGYGGNPAKLSSVYTPSANEGGLGGWGNLGTGGSGGYASYWNGITTMTPASAGSRSSGQGAAGAGGSGSCFYTGANWSGYGNAGAGGGIGQTSAGPNASAGAGTAGGLGASGGQPNALYKSDFIGCPSVGGTGWAVGGTNIPNGASPTGFWGAGGAGGGSYANVPPPPSFTGGNGGAGANGIIWVLFE